jgi:hypothetical protein
MSESELCENFKCNNGQLAYFLVVDTELQDQSKPAHKTISL